VSFDRGRRLELRVSDSHIDPGLTTPAPSLQTMIERERGNDIGMIYAASKHTCLVAFFTSWLSAVSVRSCRMLDK
jgi:hypothetical protein